MNQNENTRKNEGQKFSKTAPGEKQEPREVNQSVAPKPGEKSGDRQSQENKPRV